MKTIILLLSLIAFIPKSSINQTIRTYQKDKLIHFSTGVMVFVVCSEIYYKHKKNKKEKAEKKGEDATTLSPEDIKKVDDAHSNSDTVKKNK